MKVKQSSFIKQYSIALCGGFAAGILGALIVFTIRDTDIQTSETSRAPTSSDVVILDEPNNQTVDVVSRVSPAVVSIIVEQSTEVRTQSNTDKKLYDDFFGFALPVQQNDKKGTYRVGAGSGFIISKEGLIITNRHVVQIPSATLVVILSNQKEYPAKVVAVDPLNDIALLKIQATELPFLTFGDSGRVRIGETVIAIGNALGEFQNSVTKGIVSGINRKIVAGNGMTSDMIEGAIQTDAAINQGNSGGPLINEEGNVIGINTALSHEGQLLGFAIPSNIVMNAVDSFTHFGRIVRPWLGVLYVMLNAEIKVENNLASDHGAFITPGTKASPGILKNSPADKIGLRERDIIISIDGIQIDEKNSLSRVIGKHKVGDTITLTILRDTEELHMKAVLEEFTKSAINAQK